VTACLKVMNHFLNHVHFRAQWMDVVTQQDPTLLATDLADVLVGEGVPFREAHGIVGAWCVTPWPKRSASRTFPTRTSGSIRRGSEGHGPLALPSRVGGEEEDGGGPSPANVVAQVKALKATARKLDARIPHEKI